MATMDAGRPSPKCALHLASSYGETTERTHCDEMAQSIAANSIGSALRSPHFGNWLRSGRASAGAVAVQL